MTNDLKLTPVMRRTKTMLHKACPEKTLTALTMNDSELSRYIAPTPLPLMRKWIADQPDLWPWFLTPVDADANALHAKELAYAFLVEILSLDTIDTSGALNTDVLKAKQKAVELLLAKDKPMVSVSNNTLSQHAHMGTLAPGAVPRGLKGKNPAMLESKIALLAEASDDDTLSQLPAEDEL